MAFDVTDFANAVVGPLADLPAEHPYETSLTTLPAKRTYWTARPEGMCRFVNHPDTVGQNLYFSLGLVHAEQTPNDVSKRITTEICTGSLGLALDLDLRTEAHPGEGRFQSREEIFRLFEKFPFPPTIVLHTGNGYQIFWLFREPHLFSEPAAKADFRKLARAFHHYHLIQAKILGREIDSTYDLARILRIGGTKNFKDPQQVRDVVIETISTDRAEPSDFEEFLEIRSMFSLLHDTDVTGQTVEPDGSTFVLDHSRRIDPGVIEALCEVDSTFKRTWNHERKADFQKDSQSEYDLSLANQAVGMGWTDQQIVDLLVTHRSLRQVKNSRRSDVRYYAQTIALARTAANRTVFGTEANAQPKGRKEPEPEPEPPGPPPEEDTGTTEEEPPKDAPKAKAAGAHKNGRAKEGPAPPPPPDPAFDRARSLEALSITLGLPIHNIRMIPYHPTPWTVITDRMPLFLTEKEVMNGRNFREKIAKVYNVWIPPYKDAQWAKISKLIIAASEVSEILDIEDNPREAMTAYLSAILPTRAVAVDTDDLVGKDSADTILVLDDGSVAIFGPSLKASIQRLFNRPDWTKNDTKSGMDAIGARSEFFGKQRRYVIPVTVFDGKVLRAKFHTEQRGDHARPN